jgi:tetratricopeptide (TPR) repeat protein
LENSPATFTTAAIISSVAPAACGALVTASITTPNDRGLAYFRKGQADRAIENFDQAIRLNPNYAATFFNRGLDVPRHAREPAAPQAEIKHALCFW